MGNWGSWWRRYPRAKVGMWVSLKWTTFNFKQRTLCDWKERSDHKTCRALCSKLWLCKA